MKRIILSLFGALLVGSAIMAKPAIGYTAIPPVIGDDVIDAMWLPITPTSIRLQNDGTGSYAGQWRALYDDTHLYFLIEVKDNNPVNNTTNIVDYYKGDAVELYISKDTIIANAYQQLGFGYAPGKSAKPYQSNAGTNGSVAPGPWINAADWYFTRVTTSTLGGGTHLNGTGTLVADETGTYSGYFLELSIPFSVLGVILSPSDPNSIAMEVAINQSDNGTSRTAQMTSYKPGDHFQRTTNYTPTDLLPCTPLASFPTSTVCNGGVFNIEAAGTAVSSDRWWRKDGSAVWAELTNGAGSLILTESGLSTGEYEYTYMNGTGTSCRATVNVGSDISFDIPSTFQCDGSNNAQIKVSTITGGNAPYTYYYTIDGSGTETVIPSLATDRIFTLPTTTDNYKVIVKDNNGCRDTSNVVTSTFPAALVAGDITAQCNGTTSTLTVTRTGGYWYSRNNGTDWHRSNIFNDIPSSVKQCDVVLKDSLTGCYVEFPKDMPYIADFTFDFQCNDETTLALKEVTPATGSGNYEYTFNGEIKTTFDFTAPIANGTYTVKVKDTGSNCEMEVSNTFAKPTVSLTPSGDVQLKAGDPDLKLEASSTESTYQWKKNSDILDETSDSYTVNVNNSIGTTVEYSVKARAANNCLSDPASATVTVIRSDLPNAIDISAGINDLNRVFAAQAGTELYIFNRYGTTVYKEKVDNVLALKGWNGCYDNKSGKEVEPGVYYYVLIVGDDTAKGAVEVVKSK
ncbi:MAG: gliding motility-associated C-terminal domain-containing protein [Prevotellaceae bacterium]|jgi:hypothetical protein|nr:gliding motility-associated C-terminal domain-containing protein [Prevotellaceae bacterium]